MHTLGLALGGGGVAGCSHIGVICAMEEEGIRIDLLAGTSAGSMVAALYAYGYSGKELADKIPEMTKKMLDYDYGGLLRHLLLRGKPLAGLIKGERLRAFLSQELGHAAMADMKLPLAVTATDLKSARQVLFFSDPFPLPAKGCEAVDVIVDASAVEAVMASMAIPGLFRPVVMGGRVLVDGGLADNCPTAVLKKMGARKVLAVNLVSVKPVHTEFRSCYAVLLRALSMGLHRLSLANAGCADLVLNPEVESIGIFDFSSVADGMEKGYEYARRRMPDIWRMLEEDEDDETVEEVPVESLPHFQAAAADAGIPTAVSLADL